MITYGKEHNFYSGNIKKYFDVIYKRSWQLIFDKDNQSPERKIRVEHVSCLLNISSTFEKIQNIKVFINKIEPDDYISMHDSLEYHFNNFYFHMYIIYEATKHYLGVIKNRYKPHDDSEYITHAVKVLKDKVVEPFFKPYKKTRNNFTHLKSIRIYHPKINDMSLYSNVISGSKDIKLNDKGKEEINAMKDKYFQMFDETAEHYITIIDTASEKVIELFDICFKHLYETLIVKNDIKMPNM